MIDEKLFDYVQKFVEDYYEVIQGLEFSAENNQEKIDWFMFSSLLQYIKTNNILGVTSITNKFYQPKNVYYFEDM